jgi:hypothetical protein
MNEQFSARSESDAAVLDHVEDVTPSNQLHIQSSKLHLPLNSQWECVAECVESEISVGAEGNVGALPRRVRKGPSDRLGHRRLWEECSRIALTRAVAEAAQPLYYGRCCLVGLICLEVIRVAEWLGGRRPYFTVLGMHCLAATADLACVVCTIPLYVGGVQGQCVTGGCLGPLLTLVFAMTLVSISSFVAFLIIATPHPVSQGTRSYLDLLEANATAWEFTLIGSVALDIALCKASWKVYKELRLTGLYPPGVEPVGIGRIREVSPLEVFCEAEDLECLSSCNQSPGYTDS